MHFKIEGIWNYETVYPIFQEQMECWDDVDETFKRV